MAKAKQKAKFEKQDIIKKILGSKKCFKVLGTAYIDIDLVNDRDNFQKSILEILHNHFKKEDYEIDIIAEPLSQLAKIAAKTKGEAYGTLTSKQSVYTELFRKYFVDKKTNNIEPTDDDLRYQLDKIFNIEFIDNIVREVGYINKASNQDNVDNTVLNIPKDLKARFCEQMKNGIASLLRKTAKYKNLEDSRSYRELTDVEESFDSKLKNDIIDMFECCTTAEEMILEIDKYTKKDEKQIKYNYKNMEFVVEDADFMGDKLVAHLSNILVNSALSYLYQNAKRDYKQIRDSAAYKANSKREQELETESRKKDHRQRLHVKTYCDEIYYHMLKIDDEYFVISKTDKVAYILAAPDSKEALYFDEIMNDKNVAEKTKKGNREEIVPCYITVNPAEGNAECCNRYQIGQRARDAFYYDKNNPMPFVKNVAWALVFDRKGNVLLQKRGMNAKDNQDMWDKSVGGHISVDDPNVIYGARREIIEELFTVEGFEQSHVASSGLLKKDPAKIIFLGYWDEKRYPQFKDALKQDASMKLDDDEFYCFKFECPLVTNVIKSRRKLPSGKELYANCFVDLFFVITSKDFDVSELKNAKYLVLPPHDVQNCYRSGELTRGGKTEAERFDVTPDLEELLSNAVWDNEITKFANNVKLAFEKN